MTRGDGIVIAIVVAAALASVPVVSVATTAAPARSVTVVAPTGRSTLSLLRDGTYVIEGRRGDVVVRVAGGQARCVEADCPDQICVRTGAVRPGRPVVCAPNGVCVSAGEGEVRGLDAISR